MKQSFVVLLLSLFGSLSLLGQRLASSDSVDRLFAEQKKTFPQEKIYMQIDKPFYVSGEKIWFKIYLVDATNHNQLNVSRFVYVELIDPMNRVLTRLKIHPQEGQFYGHIPLEAVMPEGSYSIRAYTRYMESLGEDYFFRQIVQIGNPYSASRRAEPLFKRGRTKNDVTIRFIDTGRDTLIAPEQVTVTVNGANEVFPRIDKKFREVNITMPDRVRGDNGWFLIEQDKKKDNYGRYIFLPTNQSDFDLTFFPEGGDLIAYATCRVGFKVINERGLGENVSFNIYDNHDKLVLADVRSTHRGMGSFDLRPTLDATYYAVGTNSQGETKRFDLPPVYRDGYALATHWVDEGLAVALNHNPTKPLSDSLYILIHCRGNVVYADLWDNSYESLLISKKLLPVGVLQVMLFDKASNPISERLAFNKGNASPQILLSTDKSNYAKRDKVLATIRLNDVDGQALQGNVSVAVTDNLDVDAARETDIVSSLLLTSELRGSIESPNAYFEANDAATNTKLDILMMTQGWRRYNTPAILKGQFEQPQGVLELGSTISGRVTRPVISTPVRNANVTLVALARGYWDITVTDDSGYFIFDGVELPDSTYFSVNTTTKKGYDKLVLSVNQDTFPVVTRVMPVDEAVFDRQFYRYVAKADRKYVLENGVRTIELSEVSVSAIRKDKRISLYMDNVDFKLSRDDVEKANAIYIQDLFRRISGIQVVNGVATFRRQAVKFIIDDVLQPREVDLGGFSVSDVDEVGFIKPGNAILGFSTMNGAIVITTKRGEKITRPNDINQAIFSPLGYQKPAEFYAPLYDTEAKRLKPSVDLRSTIYWNPSLTLDESGEAAFEFYAADINSTYNVVIEGIGVNGEVIRQTATIAVEQK